jgi:hypothetical protein
MRQCVLSGCLFAALTGWVLPGCRSVSAHRPYPDDPLLVAHKPLPGKAESPAPALVARAEPEAPPLPPVAVAAKPARPNETAPRPPGIRAVSGAPDLTPPPSRSGIDSK